MVDKVKCNDCSALILPTTSERTGGLCMPCKNGNRKNIEAAKEHYKRERELDKSCPFRALWRELVHRVHYESNGFSSLTEHEKQYFSVNVLIGDVYNGGFNQYFGNSSSDYYTYAESGLVQIGATESLKLLRQAKADMFGGLKVPESQEGRWVIMRTHATEPDLDVYDTDFYEDRDDLETKLENYAIEVGLVKNA
jgi:hypothetical protein